MQVDWRGARTVEYGYRANATPSPREERTGRGPLGEGHPTADIPAQRQARRPSSPHPSPPSAGGAGEERGAINTSSRSSSAARRSGDRAAGHRGPFAAKRSVLFPLAKSPTHL